MHLPGNLTHLRKAGKLSQQTLADHLDIPRTTLGDYERGKSEPNIEMLIRMTEYFSVTMDELLKVDLRKNIAVLSVRDHLKVLAISVDSGARGNVELVGTKAEAGYLENFSDPEFIGDLPKIQLPGLPAGTFRGFEIQGDSMLPLEPGSIILSSFVERLDEIRDGRTYVIISKREGVVYKRVKNLPEREALMLFSDNENYSPFSIGYEEIDEIWKYYAHISFSDLKSSLENYFDERIRDIQQRVVKIEDRLKQKKGT